ncbi:MAG: redoxin domain-containing protein [Syntrophorhabdus sp.]|nr:redoxin domain-containing protein [Syntrophorhabdus sp.]
MPAARSLWNRIACVLIAAVLFPAGAAYGQSAILKDSIYDPGKLKPRDSHSTLKPGDIAPDFTLPSIAGGLVSLHDYRGRNNVVVSFVPAAWTPVCSDQWPGYNIVKNLFDRHDAVLLGITVDNIPTLYAWTRQMSEKGLWFPVLSDFYPHGAVASKYGILRTNGESERALFVINKKGVITYIDIHDINKRPRLEDLAKALQNLHD